MPTQTAPRPPIDTNENVSSGSEYAAPQTAVSPDLSQLPPWKRLAAELLALFPFVAGVDLLIHGDMFQRLFAALRQGNADLPIIATPALWIAAHPVVAFLIAGIQALCIWRLMIAGKHSGALTLGAFGAFFSVMFLTGRWFPGASFLRAQSL